MKHWLLLSFVISVCHCSFVFIDWTLLIPADLHVDDFLLQYSPPIGSPPSSSILPANTRQTVINGTSSATQYRVMLSARTKNAQQLLIMDKRFLSSPNAPEVYSIKVEAESATLTLEKYETDDLSYYVEFYPVGQIAAADFVESRKNVVKINKLLPNTEYIGRVLSVFRGTPSADQTDIKFITKILPISKNRLDKTVEVSGRTEMNGVVEDKKGTSVKSTSKSVTSKPITTKLLVNHVITRKPLTTTTSTPTTTTSTPTTTTSTPTTTTTSFVTTTRLPDVEPKVRQSSNLVVTAVMFDLRGDVLHMSWEPFDGIVCDRYKLFYKHDGDPRPTKKEMYRQEFVFKLLKVSPLYVEILCTDQNGDTVKNWRAKGYFEANRPNAVQGLEVTDAYTNERNLSSFTISWVWPGHNFDDYVIMMSYKGDTDSTAVNKNVSSTTSLELSELSSAETYTITMRNVSLALNIVAEETSVKVTTPPLILSDIIEGIITTTSAEVKFTETAEAKFDRYELVFEGDKKNFTKIFERDEKDPMFKMEDLTPGRSYRVLLYTILRGIRSRAVENHVTTYPIPVSRTLAVVGDNEVVLHWAVQQYDTKHMKFRIGYHDADNSKSRSIFAHGRRFYRFTSLTPATWYTFTISVVTKDIESSSVSVNLVTNPSDLRKPEVSRTSSQEMSVRYRSDMFPLLNGRLTEYKIIMAPTSAIGDILPYPLPTWQMQQGKTLSEQTAYQTNDINYEPFKSSATEIYTAGSDQSCLDLGEDVHCNGQLSKFIKYAVKVRGCTRHGICMDSQWVQPGKQNAYWAKKGKSSAEETDEEQVTTPEVQYLNNLWYRIPFQSAASCVSPCSIVIVCFELLLLLR